MKENFKYAQQKSNTEIKKEEHGNNTRSKETTRIREREEEIREIHGRTWCKRESWAAVRKHE